ncbi:hypothetical protein RAH32_08780 [Paracoccus sp. WLY502]|uniref:hypothetical protein n=1 Tax=Paracoccus yibinensis TaxID=3068891 RepID=UPI0027964D46|nr:hypothetical protein [Paracoccus sp. WLY502]MDQ1900538.1 hypothetical protein [Paracoccus sp. WLY502]
MLGKALSRWTLAWFASAMAFLLAALAMATFGLAGPGRWSEGWALAAVHLFALGWLCQMMLGSLIQFVPVLTARPLILPRLALPALILCGAGTLSLAGGFLALDGWPTGVLLAAGPVLLGLAFGLAMLMLGGTLVATRAWRTQDGSTVLLALLALPVLWVTGAGMGWAFGGIAWGAALLPDGLSLHVLLGAGFWLTLAAMGVSYRLFPMFLIAPDGSSPWRRAALIAAALALALLLAALGVLLAGGDPLPLAVACGLACAFAAGLYLGEIRRIWQSRRAPAPETNMQWSRAALAFLALAALLVAPALILGGPWAEAAVFVALAGWLSTLTLAQMVKITSFLTWIQVFAPLIGRAPVPMVHDLTDARAAGRSLALWVAGVLVGAAALAAQVPALFDIAALVLLLAALLHGHELIAIRRLRHLSETARPAGLPPMILPPSDRRTDHDIPRPASA